MRTSGTRISNMSSTQSHAPSASLTLSRPEVQLVTRLSAFCLVAGSGFYLTQIVEISPVYAFMALSAGLALLTMLLAPAAWLFPRLETRDLDRCVGILVWTTVGLGAAEALVRWVFPFQELDAERAKYIVESGAVFYVYKFNSIMYQDSNFVGMWLLV